MVFKYESSVIYMNILTNDSEYYHEFDKNNLPFIIHYFKTENNNNGEGTELLRQVKDFADNMKRNIIVQPWNMMLINELRRFYIRNGFIDNGDYFIYRYKQ